MTSVGEGSPCIFSNTRPADVRNCRGKRGDGGKGGRGDGGKGGRGMFCWC